MRFNFGYRSFKIAASGSFSESVMSQNLSASPTKSKAKRPAALSPEFSLLPEGADETGAFTADAAQGMGGPAGELPEIAGAQVG